jgi:hypothetical protein
VIVDEVSPRTAGILAHEMVHVELGARARRAFVPQWFHEGAAASIGDAPTCEPALPPGVDDLRRLDANDAWAAYTSQRDRLHPTYCQARAEFEAWAARFGPAQLAPQLDFLFEALRNGAPFDAVYGPLRTGRGAPARHAPPATTLNHAVVTLAGDADSDVVQSAFGALSDPDAPFSLLAWVRPARVAGVLAHLSSSPDGSGWCTPLLGFDATGRLIGQVLRGHGPAPENYGVTTYAPRLPLGRWTHVAMTFSPGASQRLFVNGALVAEIAAPTINLPAAPWLTWGSSNTAGADCWRGAVAPEPFRGSLSEFRAHAAALTPEDIAELARHPPEARPDPPCAATTGAP